MLCTWSCFRAWKGKIVSEITPAYSASPGRSKSIRALLGDIKIIYMIRHPVPRAWSSFKMLCRNTGLDINGMDTDTLLQAVSRPRMLRYLDVRSDYLTQTQRWGESFPNISSATRRPGGQPRGRVAECL